MTTGLYGRLVMWVGVSLCSGALLWNGDALRAQSASDSSAKNRDSCQRNLAQVFLALAQYEEDYDEKLPPAKGWLDALTAYVKSESVFTCPSLPKAKRYGYAYNPNLAGETMGLLSAKPKRTTVIYETTLLKRNLYGLGEDRAFRHLYGANYAFADGHIKWLPKTATPSFNLKP